jgi:hypothetical protein
MSYKVNKKFTLKCGFEVSAADVEHAAILTNKVLSALPASLFRSIDYKTSSAIIGAVFCESLADRTKAIVNPIEKGHPDILPSSAAGAPEAQLRNYPYGVEVKSTIGNIAKGRNLRAGVKRVEHITGITWQAHHQDVASLMGLAWDFVQPGDSFDHPGITGVFFAGNLKREDWGKVSGTTGRNTKVSGMRSSGKEKMGNGWILLWDEKVYIDMFKKQFDCLSIDA